MRVRGSTNKVLKKRQILKTVEDRLEDRVE